MIFAGIMTALLVALPVILLISALRDGWDALGYLFSFKKYFLSDRKKMEIRDALSSLTYYRNLSAKGKEEFFNRTLSFMFTKSFEGKHGLEVTESMKALIAAAAVQLTFGLKKYKLTHVETIYVYPSIFKGPGRREYKGMTTRMGSMSFSWEDFRQGYEDDRDRYNLGLHEMSHALQLTLVLSSEMDNSFASYFDNWQEVTSKEFADMKHSGPSFLREYAGTNKSEFFAVCIEHFFEAPEEFENALPDVYNHLAVLLNQNPMNVYNDYVLDKAFIDKVNSSKGNIPVPGKIQSKFRYSTWHWSLTLLFIGIFGGLGSLAYLYHRIAESVFVLAFIYLLCAWVGMLQKNYFMKKEILDKKLFRFYVYAGFAPLMMAVILWINYLVPVTDAWQEEYTITGYSMKYKSSKRSRRSAIVGYSLDLNDNAYLFTPSVRRVGVDYNYYNRVVFQFRRGLFGMKINEGYYFPAGEKLPQP